jgi:predicted TIM-barrel fold metal-dependent hydrolase
MCATSMVSSRPAFACWIMFGSDFPNQLVPGIDAILGADFLSAEQKADILCNNARFLRLDASVGT